MKFIDISEKYFCFFERLILFNSLFYKKPSNSNKFILTNYIKSRTKKYIVQQNKFFALVFPKSNIPKKHIK